MLNKNSRFWARAPPLKLVYIGAEGAFKYFLGSVSQKSISKDIAKRGPFKSALGRIPEGSGGGGGVCLLPKSAPGHTV